MLPGKHVPAIASSDVDGVFLFERLRVRWDALTKIKKRPLAEIQLVSGVGQIKRWSRNRFFGYFVRLRLHPLRQSILVEEQRRGLLYLLFRRY